MSHSWDCPDDYEARRQAQRDAERDLPYSAGFTPRGPYDCDEGNETYRREYRYQFDRLEEERRIERRQQERRQEERQHEEWEMQQQYEAEQRASTTTPEPLRGRWKKPRPSR